MYACIKIYLYRLGIGFRKFVYKFIKYQIIVAMY